MSHCMLRAGIRILGTCLQLPSTLSNSVAARRHKQAMCDIAARVGKRTLGAMLLQLLLQSIQRTMQTQST